MFTKSDLKEDFSMRVHLIKRQAIEEYVTRHDASKTSFEYYVTNIKYENFKILCHKICYTI